MSEVAEMAAEVIAEGVEETIDGVVDTIQVMRTNPVALAAAVVVGGAIGAAGAYLITKKRMTTYYEELMVLEIGKAKSFYASVNKVHRITGRPLSPQDLHAQLHPEEAKAAMDALTKYAGDEVPEEPEPDEDEIKRLEEQDEEQLSRFEKRSGRVPIEDAEDYTPYNVFSKTDSDTPYPITHDEYFAAEKNYEQITLTYFERDDTLVNDQDTPVATDDTIGDEALTKFGHGSKDPNVVYVRNDKLQIDYDVTLSRGSYVEEALGLGPDPEENSLRHSADRRRNFRNGHDG